MQRLFGQALAVVSIGSVAAVVAPACAENDQSIFIRAALAPAQNRQNGACVWTSDPTQATLIEGVLDVAVRDSYVSMLLVGNQLKARGDTNNTRAESNRAHVNGAVVRVTDPNGGQLGEFTSLANGFIDPQLNNTPAFGSVLVTSIDFATREKIAAGLAPGQTKLVVANIKAYGKTLGGVDLESGEFQLPIRVCNGCLISFASGDDPATPDVIECNPATDDTASSGSQTLPCFPGQDEVTPCETCLNRPACQTFGG